MASLDQNKIKKTAAVVRGFSIVLMVAIFGLTVWVWMDPLGTLIKTGFQMTANSGVVERLVASGYQNPLDLTLTRRIVGFFISGIPMAILIFVLWQVSRLMGFFMEGRYISAASVKAVARAAIGLLFYPLAAILSETLLILYLTMENPEGQRMLSFSISGGDVMTLFLGAALLMIARAFNMEKERAEEHASII